MAAAYTPGLTVSESASIRRTRRLPLKGDVLVRAGEAVAPETPVARTLLPGVMRTVKAAEILGLEPEELPPALLIRQGDVVEAGQVIARTSSFFGLFRSECKATASGTVELISPTTGHVGIREPPIAVEVNAYIRGEVVEVQPEEGVVIETRGALVQGIFGVGGERRGILKAAVSDPGEPLDESRIGPTDAGRILVGGSQVTGAALRRASEVGAAGVIAGGDRGPGADRFPRLRHRRRHYRRREDQPDACADRRVRLHRDGSAHLRSLARTGGTRGFHQRRHPDPRGGDPAGSDRACGGRGRFGSG